MRNRYRRMSPDDLSYALDTLNLSAGKFARLCGHQRKRVLAWLDGTEQIPHHINVLCAIWLSLPIARNIALTVTNGSICEEEDDMPDT